MAATWKLYAGAVRNQSCRPVGVFGGKHAAGLDVRLKSKTGQTIFRKTPATS
ncbi:MAG: hypothetical protein WKF37_02980 [Bryobacteraceae bacterium]